MQSLTFEIGKHRARLAGFCVRSLVLAALIALGALLPDRPATAASCGALAGKALYDCVATYLDGKADMIGRVRGDPEAPVVARSLQTAASQLRAATSKVQALSAITQARSAISGIIQQAKSAGRDSQGWGRVIGTLTEMASLIQKKG
jgi:hypothetical protein